MLQLLEHLIWMFETILQKLYETSTTNSFTPDAVGNYITEFLYSPEVMLS